MPIHEASAPPSTDASTTRTRGALQPAWQRCLQRAETQISQQRYARAISSLERAMAQGADRYDCTLRIAEVYCRMQQWAPALSTAEQAMQIAPNRLPAYEMAMTIALEAGDSERAFSAGQALIKLSPRHIAAHDTLGAVYMQKGDVDAAMRVLNKLIRIDPKNPTHHFKKALLCQHKGEVVLAMRELTETLRIDPAGVHAEAAQEALETLDAYQLNQIFILAMEDSIFRAKLTQDAEEAVAERGFLLSEVGNQIVAELSTQTLPDLPVLCRPTLYN